MAKKSSVERNQKRVLLVQRYQRLRDSLRQQLSGASSLEEQRRIHEQLQALPRNSAPNRVYRRCFVTGRPRSVSREFGLSRHVFREMAHCGLLPGVTKSSW